MNSFDQAGTAPRVGLIELPDLADLLARSGVAVVSGANFREAATNVKEASASSPLPLIIGDRPTSEDGRPAPGINMWSKKMSAQHRVAVIRNHTEKHLDIENAVEITLPTTVNTILAALGMQPLAADAAYPAGAQAAPAAAPEAAPAESAAPGFFDAPAPAQQLEAPAPADFYAAPAPAQQFEAPAAPAVPADFYAAPAPAPQFEAPAPAAPAVPADFYAAPAPAPQFEAPAPAAPADFYAPAPAPQFEAPAPAAPAVPADFYAAPAPARQFEAPGPAAPGAPADFYAAPAPAPQFEAPAPAAPAVPADFYAAPAPAQQFEAPAPAAPADFYAAPAPAPQFEAPGPAAPAVPADFYAAPAPAQQFEAPVPVPDFSAAPSPAAAMQFETPAPAASSAGDFFNAAPAPAPQAPTAPAAGSFYAPPAPAQQFEAPAPAPGDFFNAPAQGQFAAAPAQQFDAPAPAPAPAPGDFFNAPGQGQFGAPVPQFEAPAPAPAAAAPGDFFNAPAQGQFAAAPAQQFDAPAPGDFFNAPGQGQFGAPVPQFEAPAPAPAAAAPGGFFNAPAQGQFAAAPAPAVPAPAFTASEDAFFGGPSVPAAPARGNAPAAPMVQQMPMDVSESFDSHQAARRRSAGHSTTHLANVIVCIAGKGGVGKTTTAVSLAQIAAEAGLRVILIDGNVGQADLRTYLRTANSDLPTIYDAAIGRESAIVSPGQLNGVRRPEQGQVKFGFVAGPPHDESVDQYVVTNQDYIKVIQEARQKVDLVILDTQILEARDDSHFVSDVIQPLLVESAFALGIADMTSPGVKRLNERLISLINHGTPKDRIMIMINNVPEDQMVVADNGQRYFDMLGNFVGAVPTNVPEIHDVMNAGSVPSDNRELRTVLTDVLSRSTGADVFNAVPEESEPSAEAKGGLFSRMFKKKAA